MGAVYPIQVIGEGHLAEPLVVSMTFAVPPPVERVSMYTLNRYTGRFVGFIAVLFLISYIWRAIPLLDTEGRKV